MKIWLRFLVFLGLGIFVVNRAMAAIGVDPVILNFTAGNPLAQNVLVQNSGAKTAYVKITPYVIEHPGTRQQKKIHVYNPSTSGILVYPNRLIIPARQQRYVRLMLTQSLDKTDRIYRISFIPTNAGLTTVKKVKGKEVGLHIIIGYGVLAMARPEHAKPLLKFKRESHRLIIKNVGNTNIFVSGGKQCNKHHKCFNLPARRMYAGNTWTFQLPYKTPVTIKTDWNENYKTYTVK